MITDTDIIRGYNNAGVEVNADLLNNVFTVIDDQSQVAVHNFIMGIIKRRITVDQQENFCRSVAGLIEQYSLRNIENGEAKKS